MQNESTQSQIALEKPFWALWVSTALCIAHVFSNLAELRSDPSGRHAHGDGLYGTDLIVAEALFFGNAKEMRHSGVTA